MNCIIDKFWSEYTDFKHNNGPFDGDYLICISKDIQEGNIHLWNKNYHLACTKVIGFVACRVISKIIGIGSSGSSWSDVRTIKSGKRSIIRSDVSDKQIIVYISICIESDRNGKTDYESNINGCHTRHI